MTDPHLLDAVHAALMKAMERGDRTPFVLGICGAQGSGKSTLAAALSARCESAGFSTALLSIDDFYLTRAERTQLAIDVHPLLRTRGVPGTHDVELGLRVLEDLDDGRPAVIPRFDKACDDRAPRDQWDATGADTQLLIFEGWCVGALPQAEAALAEPVNALERDEDPHGSWRRYVNAALADDYQMLFARIDLLVLLAAPSFDVVLDWRIEQERGLPPGSAAAMPDLEIARFTQHYERLTRHILTEMPRRADLVAQLGEDRSLSAIMNYREP